jgi:DNA-directed RNA polymerase II subunit RPB2
MSDGTEKPVGQLKNGDMIKTVNPVTLEISITPIHKWFRIHSTVSNKKILELTTVLGKRIRATSDHQFLSLVDRKNKWIELELLGPSDYVCVQNSDCSFTFDQVSSIKQVEDAYVCDFTTLSNTHSMISSGFVTHNCTMGSQAMSIFALNGEFRADTLGYELMHTQQPLVQTILDPLIGGSYLSTGANPMISIQCYTGYGQEDSVIISKGAVDRGLFVSVYERCYKDQEKNHGVDSTKFERPGKNVRGLRNANYDRIEMNGLPKIGTILYPKDVIIGKTMNTVDPSDPSNVIKRDNSILVKGNEPVKVKKIIKSTNKKGHKTVKVIVQTIRVPEIGDKFSARHGQKGTAGIFCNQEDLPFCPKTGMTPDIILNPHAFPSRMTIGMLFECLQGKLACYNGKIADGTPFRSISIDDIEQELRKYGCTSYGKDVLYNGFTGEKIESKVFYAPSFYQRLKHVVVDKIHSRARGPKQILTRQPVEGRSRDGGFRMGEMERDCMIAHGCSAFLLDRLFYNSDAYSTVFCKQCGMMAVPAKPQGVYIKNMLVRAQNAYCRNCQTHDHVVDVKLPYACKLMIQEMMAMNLAFKLILG